MRRADLVVLPYERSERFGFSGVLATALAFGKPIVLTDIGGFAEVAALGAARAVPAGDAGALHAALSALLADARGRAELAAAAAGAAAGPFSWDAAARATLDLYAALG
jgi:glycosyltransferase involved in cell wall biosynthesis